MKKYVVSLIFLVFVLLLAGCSFKNSENEDAGDIIKYEFQTHEYFDFLYGNPNAFYIDSEKELNAFHSLFSDKLEINKDDLKNNTVFVKVMEVTSGSDEMKLDDVTFTDNIVNFSISVDGPEIGTADMACWYLVAIIPNQKLKGIKYDGWVKPSKAKFKK